MSRLALALALVVLGTSPAHAEERERRDYTGPMVLTDLAILVSAIPVMERSDGHEEEVVGLYLLAYVASGPIIHGLNGNTNEAGVSLAKRVVLPVLLGAVGLGVGIGLQAGLASIALAAVGTGIGVISAVVSDWTSAHVDVGSTTVVPSVSADRDRVSLGLGGAF